MNQSSETVRRRTTVSSLLFAITAIPSAPILAQAPQFSIDGGRADDRLGFAVSAAGDVNLDGIPDILMGAPVSANPPQDPGYIRVCSGVDGSVLYTLHGQTVGESFGWSVSGGSDLNGDGHADFLTGAPVAGPTGLVRAFSGADGSALYTVMGDTALDHHFGTSIEIAGDVDNDGDVDVIVGSLQGLGPASSGRCVVLSGPDGSEILSILGDAASAYIGSAVSGIGDVDGDGHDDLLVGDMFDSHADIDAGRVWLFSGSDGSVLRTVDGDRSAFYLAGSIDGMGDVDADGVPDLVVGSPWAVHPDITDTDGCVRVYSGRDGTCLLERWGGGITGSALGNSVSDGGFLDGDEAPDVLAGDPIIGSATFFSSGQPNPWGSGIGWLSAGSYGDSFGYDLDTIGDLDQDGRTDYVVGAPRADPNGVDSGTVHVFSSPCGQAVYRGAGCPGDHGVPYLSATGCAKRNRAIELLLERGVPGSPALILVGDTFAGIPLAGSCVLRVFPLLEVHAVTLNEAGGFAIPATIPGTVVAGSIHLQAAVLNDAGFNGYSLSNGLMLDIL